MVGSLSPATSNKSFSENLRYLCNQIRRSPDSGVCSSSHTESFSGFGTRVNPEVQRHQLRLRTRNRREKGSKQRLSQICEFYLAEASVCCVVSYDLTPELMTSTLGTLRMKFDAGEDSRRTTGGEWCTGLSESCYPQWFLFSFVGGPAILRTAVNVFRMGGGLQNLR